MSASGPEEIRSKAPRKSSKDGPSRRARCLASATDEVFVTRDELDRIARRLDIVVSSVVVCRLALTGQNAERDQDIAEVLRWCITDELARQVERIDQLTHSRLKILRTQRNHRKPAKAPGVHVPRRVLNDVRYRLTLVAGCTTVCRDALRRQNADRDCDIAATLQCTVIDVVFAQIQRIRSIGTERQRKRQRIVRVTP